MLPSRIATLLSVGAGLLAVSLVVAAPPKTAGSKKKKADPVTESSDDAGDAKSDATKAKSERAGDADGDAKPKKVVKTDAEWRKLLTREQFRVARKKGTEVAFSGIYARSKKDGIYECVCCGQPLFDSKTKFESGTGWPSFYDPIDKKAVTLLDDTSDNMVRVEVECSRCDGHLGHVFEDGPPPTGQRYCMNSASLKFVARADVGKEKTQEKTQKEPKAGSSKAKGKKAPDAEENESKDKKSATE
jgi:peptide-methionine (R)-S-oxide reductase